MPDTPSSSTDRTRWSRRLPPARSPAAGLALLALLLAVYVPGLFSLPVVDRDEARFAQASRQMLESWALPPDARDTRPIEPDANARLTGGLHAGGWAVPMVGERPRLAKPPLIYWLQSGAAAVLTGGNPLNDRVWHYRLPSVLGSIAACLITWRLGVAMGHARAGWLGAALLGVCPMVVWDAHQARADQLLLATTTAAMGALLLLRMAPPGRTAQSWGLAIVFWVAIGAGVLTKGPVTPMIALLTAATVSWVARDWRWLWRTRPVVGVVVLTVMLAPWAMVSARAVGWDTLAGVWIDETLGRSAEPKEGHWGPPGYHLVLLAVLFWPGSLLTLYALTRAARRAMSWPPASSRAARWRARVDADDATLFLLAWIVPAWLVFEIIGTKLPHYTLPLYPPIALLTARAVLDLADGVATPDRPVPPKPALILWLIIGAALTVGVPIAAASLAGDAASLGAAIVGGLVALALIIIAARAARGCLLRAHAFAVTAAVVFVWVLLQFVLPGVRLLRVTDQLATLIAIAPSEAPVAAAGYMEDSLVFATRGRLVKLSPNQVPRWVGENPGGVLVLPSSAPAQPGWTELRRVQGINYSKGERVDLRVFRVGTSPAD